jgi:protein SCO1
MRLWMRLSWVGLLAACADAPPARAVAKKAEPGMSAAVRRLGEQLVSAPPPSPGWARMAASWVYPNPLPSFPLVDHEGRSFRLAELRTGHVLVGLIFTHCSIPKACPLTTQKMHEVGKLWRERDEAGDTKGQALRLLTLTFDPEVDTPEVLNSYSELVRKDVPSWLFATGPVDLMETTLPRMFGVIANKGSDGAIAHDVKVALLGPGLRPMQIWTDNAFEPADVVARVLD